MRKSVAIAVFILTMALVSGCGSRGPEMKTVDYVDLDRFMGKWYVIANIPTFIEKGAHNAVETYSLNEDDTIATTFTFRDGSFEGERKVYNPKGFVKDKKTNALLGMQFVWPVKADYRIVYLNDEYTHTVIGRQKRDYVWIMARTPSMPAEDYARILEKVESLGYDLSEIQKVPQQQ